jgi:hypothetical protein
VYGVPEKFEELRIYKLPVKVPVLHWGTVDLDNAIINIIIELRWIFGVI